MNLDEPILWSFRRCPYAMRGRCAVKQSGVRVRLREILLRDKPDEFLKDSSKGTVPVLRLPDGSVIDESLEVMKWALNINDPDNWLNVLEEEPAFSDNFLGELDGDFKYSLDRYKYANRYDLNEIESLAYREKGFNFLLRIEKRIEKNQFISGSKIGFLDIASLPFIRQYRIADPNWFDVQPIPRVQEMLNEFLSSALFNSIMEKYKPWHPVEGDEVIF
ncbi:MAG: glutathione S-transferase N-terminal domain-containing protein [Betaproteobacteria bacterium]